VGISDIDSVSHLEVSDPKMIESIEIMMPSDVKNPMLGERGAARVYSQ